MAPNSYNLNEEVCIKFVREIIKALNFIHERGIIHLDLKPQNIMMKSGDMEEYRVRKRNNYLEKQNRHQYENFQIKLIDFGLAKYLDKTGHAKVSFSGTVGFMAPEIARWGGWCLALVCNVLVMSLDARPGAATTPRQPRTCSVWAW